MSEAIRDYCDCAKSWRNEGSTCVHDISLILAVHKKSRLVLNQMCIFRLSGDEKENT